MLCYVIARGRRIAGPALLAAAVAATAPAAARAERNLSDQNITRAIDDQLGQTQAKAVNNISIQVRDGIVTLSGTVNNLMASRLATRVAETVKGVRAVVNEVNVRPNRPVSPDQLADDIREALRQDPATEVGELTVRTRGNGLVVLTGTVDSWAEYSLAEKVAATVPGVTKIRNQITIEGTADRPDREIKPEIERILRWDALVTGRDVDVRVTNGRVTLSGQVGSAAEKRRARNLAWVSGVRSVDDHALEVRRRDANDDRVRSDALVIKSESELRDAIHDALLYDPRVESFNITPVVEGSAVTLRGVVDNLKAKRAAARDARNTVGVSHVENQLQVQPRNPRSDARIEADIRGALARDVIVESYDVIVDVQDGTARLYGSVNSNYEKAQADDIAARVQGVKQVENNLTVDYGHVLGYDPYTYDWYADDYVWYPFGWANDDTSDAEIREEIHDELWWSPFVDADEVNVAVHDGVATLTGQVDSWSESRSAVENAYEGGAAVVHNRLTVNTYE